MVQFAGEILVLVKDDTFVLGEGIPAREIPDEHQVDIVDWDKLVVQLLSDIDIASAGFPCCKLVSLMHSLTVSFACW